MEAQESLLDLCFAKGRGGIVHETMGTNGFAETHPSPYIIGCEPSGAVDEDFGLSNGSWVNLGFLEVGGS